MAKFRHAAIAILTVCAIGGSSGVASATSITLSPKVNHPTGNVKVSGTGFGADENVDIYFDKKDETTAVTNGSGNFSDAKIKVPASAIPGKHKITAIGQSDGVNARKPFLVRTDWAQFHFGPPKDGVNPYENVLTSANVSSLAVAWTYPTGGSIESSPTIADGYLYVGSDNNSFYAINAATGTLVWTAATGGQVYSIPAVAKGVVYVGSDKLYAFDATTGAVVWTVNHGTGGSPAVANGVVYIESDKVYAFNASTGAVLWTATTGGGSSSPAVANGVVYVGSGDHKLYAFKASTGAKLWTATTGGGIDSSPAVAKGVVYVGSNDDNLYAFDASTGAVLWTAATQSEVQSSPAVANGVIYVGAVYPHALYAFNAATGAEL